MLQTLMEVVLTPGSASFWDCAFWSKFPDLDKPQGSHQPKANGDTFPHEIMYEKHSPVPSTWRL